MIEVAGGEDDKDQSQVDKWRRSGTGLMIQSLKKSLGEMTAGVKRWERVVREKYGGIVRVLGWRNVHGDTRTSSR
jgi:hypothetical protein